MRIRRNRTGLVIQPQGTSMTLMKRMAGAAALGGALMLGLGLFASPAKAGYIVILEMSGNDVVAKGQGPIDLNGLSFESPPRTRPGRPYSPRSEHGIGPASLTSAAFYIGLTGPTSFGSGNKGNQADSGSGDLVGIDGTDDQLVVPSGYVSGIPCRTPRPISARPFSASASYPAL